MSPDEERGALLEKAKELLFASSGLLEVTAAATSSRATVAEGLALKDSFRSTVSSRFRCCFCLSMYSTREGLNHHLTTKHSADLPSRDEKLAALRTASLFSRAELPSDEQRLVYFAPSEQFELLPPPIGSKQLRDEQIEEWSEIIQKQWAQNRAFTKRGVAEAYLPVGPVPWHAIASIFGPPTEHCFNARAKYQKWAWIWDQPANSDILLRVIGGADALRLEITCPQSGKLSRTIQVVRVAAFYSFRWNRFILAIRAETSHSDGTLLSASASLAPPHFFSTQEKIDQMESYMASPLTSEERSRMIDEAIAEAKANVQRIIREAVDKDTKERAEREEQKSNE